MLAHYDFIKPVIMTYFKRGLSRRRVMRTSR